jgi:hypothetical protein
MIIELKLIKQLGIGAGVTWIEFINIGKYDLFKS